MRYRILDDIRGFTLISMILYHGCWDLVNICHMPWTWYDSSGAYVWQQSICWTFIFLSGFCWSLGHRSLKRGLTVLGASALVSLVTVLFLWEDRIIFGVLTLIGSSMLLMIPLDKILSRVRAIPGLILSGGLFFITRNINHKTFGFEKISFGYVPDLWAKNYFSTYLGVPFHGFFSTDYFSLIPWFFLFTAGYFLYHIMKTREQLSVLDAEKYYKSKKSHRIKVPSFLGRHSLIIYLLHQLVLYLLCLLFFLK